MATERINQIPTTATSFATDDYLPIDGTTNGTRKILGSPILLKDSNNNITVNNVFEGFSTITASGTTVTLTIASPKNFVINGSGGQVIKLPDATTLSNGTDFIFNNNQSSGTVTVQNNSGTTVCTLQSGAYITVILLTNSTAAGTWDYHNSAPSNASWSTNTLSWAGTITNTTWNGSAVGVLYGGTGATTASGALTNLGASPVAGSTSITTLGTVTTGTWNASAIPVANGGTGSSSKATANQALTPATTTISASQIDWSQGNSFYKALSASTTFTFANAVDGQVITVTLLNSASNWTVTWPTIKWTGNTAPVMTTGAKYDVYTIYYNATIGAYFGSYVQNFT